MTADNSHGFTKPYTARQIGEHEWAVYKETGGPRLGTHTTRGEAMAQIAAIHANEGKAMPDASSKTSRADGDQAIRLINRAIQALRSYATTTDNTLTASEVRRLVAQLADAASGLFTLLDEPEALSRNASPNGLRVLSIAQSAIGNLASTEGDIRLERALDTAHDQIMMATILFNRALSQARSGKNITMPQKNRTIKIFGWGKPKPDLSRLNQYGGGASLLTGATVPTHQIAKIRMAISEISAAASAVGNIVESVQSDPDLNPAVIQNLINNAPPAQRMNPDLRQYVGQLEAQLKDASIAQALASQLKNRVVGLARVTRDIQAATGVKSVDIALYIKRRSEYAVKLLRPDPIMGKLITAVEALMNAASVLQEAVDDPSIPDAVRPKLESSGLQLSGLRQGLNGAKARLASLHIFDNIGASPDAAAFWRRRGI